MSPNSAPISFGQDHEYGDTAVCHTCVFFIEPTAVARALPLIDKVVRSYRSVQKAQVHVWPNDVMRRADLSLRAMTCAEISEVVSLVSAGLTNSWEALRPWFEIWEAHATGKDRLLVLLQPQRPDQLPLSPAFIFLSEWAVRTGAGLVWRELPDELPHAGSAAEVSHATPAWA